MTDVLGSTATDYWPKPEPAPAAFPALEALAARVGSIDSLDRAEVILVVSTDPAERQPVMELRIRKAVNKLSAKLVEIGSREISLSSLAHASLRCASDQLSGMVRALTMTGEASDFPELSAARKLLNDGSRVVVLYEDYLPELAQDARGDLLAAVAALVESLGDRVQVIPMLLWCNEMAARDFGLASDETLVQRLGSGGIQAAVISGADVATAGSETRRALEGLEFVVMTALVAGETSALADVVLPEASLAERVGTLTNTARLVQVFSAAVPSPGIARPPWQIFVELSQRWDAPLEYASPEAILTDIGKHVPAYALLLPASYAETERTSTGAEAAAR